MAEDEDAEIASRQQVFDTAELLEQILLDLPIKDLLLDQRVCKTWKNCIDNSIKLQRGLFFRPAGEMAVEELELEKQPYGIDMPHYETHFRVSTKICFINPILVIKLGYEGIAHLIIGELDETELPSSLLRPQASWRRMLATQPPLPAIKLESPPPYMVYTRVDGTLITFRAPREFEKRRRDRFFGDLQRRLIEQAKSCVAAYNIQALETKPSASGQAGGVDFTLDFEKHQGEDVQAVGTSQVPLLISSASVLPTTAV